MAAKRALWKLSPMLLRRLLSEHRGRVFTIGIARGSSLADLPRALATPRKVLQADQIHDLPAAFVADPFMLFVDGAWHMFFEIMSRLTFKGCVGHATSKDGEEWHYQGVVLSESFHMAFPQVFESEGEIYMVPDTPNMGLRLYRATDFPGNWSYERTLLDNPLLSDSSVFFHSQRWWLAAWEGRIQGQLRIYSASSLQSEWQEHPCSPVTEPADQRPGGRVVMLDGILHRFVQNARSPYGRYVRMRRISKITDTEWAEQDVHAQPILHAGDSEWRRDGMHHIDLHVEPDGNFIACVDGVRDP